MKRSAPSSSTTQASKRPRSDGTKSYCDTPPNLDSNGTIIWPAPAHEISQAQTIIRECAASKAPTVICPDKDADGLASGAILYHTLLHLGLPPEQIKVHFLPKGETVHTDEQRAAVAALLSDTESQDADEHAQRYLFVLDHGTAASPPLAPPSSTTTLIIDHHFSTPTSFPEHSIHVNASHSPPVATTALLTHTICTPLFPSLPDPSLAWLAAVGTTGDLGASLAWKPPFPDMSGVFKTHGKKAIADTVSLLNAPRRTPAYNVPDAWAALLPATSPAALLASPAAERLRDARAAVNAEVARCQAAPPKFSRDGTLAVVRIQSAAQVHPVIATRWSGTLKSRALRVVMCANEAYLPDKVNFSCRIAKCAAARVEAGEEDEVDIIAELRAWAARHESGDLLERMGSEFARGHVQASGGIVRVREFEDLMAALGVGEKVERAKAAGTSPAKSKVIDRGQTKKVTDFFAKK